MHVKITRSLRSRKRFQNQVRLFKRALLFGLLAAGMQSAASAQDVTNTTTVDVITNGGISATGNYTNTATGTINFNGPNGASPFVAGGGSIANAGNINVNFADVGITGNITNQSNGTFTLGLDAGSVGVNGNWINDGASELLINGGQVLVRGNLTNNSTSAFGIDINSGRTLTADNITNSSGSTIVNAGTIKISTRTTTGVLTNAGTVTSTGTLNGKLINNGTVNAEGSKLGTTTNSADSAFNVTGNLTTNSTFTNAGDLNLNGGNFTGITTLTNTSAIAIGDGYKLDATMINNNVDGTIYVGEGSTLQSATLTNKATIDVDAAGMILNTGKITNDTDGIINFGATGTAKLSSVSLEIENKGTINLNDGTVLVKGNVTGAGSFAIMNGATLQSGNAGQTIAQGVSIAGTSTWDTNGFNNEASGVVSGTGGLTKTGFGDLKLSGANTYTGPTNINAGRLIASGGNALANTNAVTVGAAGTFVVANAETIGSLAGAVGSQTILTENLTTGTNSDTTYSGDLSGAGKLIKQGTGTFTLDGSTTNTYAGGTDIKAGKIQANANNVLGTGKVTVGSPPPTGIDGDDESTPATLDVKSGTTQSIAALQNNASGIVDNNGTITSTARVDTSGAFNNKLAASVVNGGFDNKSGATLNNTGTVNGRVDNAGTLNSNTATSAIAGGLNNTGTANVRNSVTGAITNSGTGVMTVTGDLTGDNTVVNSGTGRIVVDGGNFTGSTSIANNSTLSTDAGLEVNASRTLSTGALTNANGAQVINFGTINSTAVIQNAGDIGNREDALITGGINNSSTGTIGNVGTIRGGIIGNSGFIASASTTSVIEGGISNDGNLTLAGRALGAIVNGSDGRITVEDNVIGDSSLTNSGSLNLNGGDFTGITTLNNMGDISTGEDRLAAGSITNAAAGSIYVSADGLLESDSTIQNSGSIKVEAAGEVYADGTITNSSTGNIVFNNVPERGAAPTGTSFLASDSNTIVNNGTIQVKAGSTYVTGDVSGGGQIKMENGSTWLQGNEGQTIANQVSLAAEDEGEVIFDSNDFSNATISGVISGDAMTKKGTGNLNLTGNNTFAGDATVKQGTLQLSGGNAIANTTRVQVDNTATLRVTDAETIGSLAGVAGSNAILADNLTTGANNASTTFAGQVSGMGALIKSGTGTMTLNNATANTHSGGTTVGAGTLLAATNNQLGTGALNVATGATLTTGASTTQTVSSANNAATINIGSGAILRGTTGVTNTGTVNVGSGGQVTSGTSIANSGTLNFNGGSAALRSDTNQITNTGRININSGTLTVKGNLLGTGLIALQNGTTLRSDTVNQRIDNNIDVASGTATLDSNGNNLTVNGNVAGVGTLNKIGLGSVTWNGTNNGLTTVNGGTLTTSTANIIGDVQTSTNSTLNLNQTSSGTYSGNISGNGQLIKDGAATTTLTGNSTYSGGTTVREGTLRVGQSGNGGIQSNVQVNQNATLGGGGIVAGNVNVSQGGRIAAGNSIGTLNITGNLTAGGSNFENELNPTQSDRVNVSGTADITGATLQNVFTPTTGYVTRMFRILDATGGVNGRFASVTNTNEPSNLLVSTFYTPTSANVVLTSMSDAILAPSTRLAMLTNAQDTLGILVNQAIATQSCFGACGEEPVLGRRLWFRALGQFNDVSSQDQLPGYQANSAGGMVGWDQQIGEQSLFGAAFSYVDTDLTMRNDARATSRVGTPRINLYSVTGFGDAAWTNVVGYGYQDIEMHRNLLGIGTAESTHSGNELTMASQMSYRLAVLVPVVGIQWAHLNENSFSEQGTPGFDMSVASSSTSSLRPYLGLNYQHAFCGSDGTYFAPQLFARYSYEAISHSNLSSIDINGSAFNVAGVRPNQHLVGLGAGFNGQWSPRLDYFANYRTDLGDRGTSQSVSGGLGFRF